MGKKDIRLVAFDMDGTVLADGAEITPRLAAVLDRLMPNAGGAGAALYDHVEWGQDQG